MVNQGYCPCLMSKLAPMILLLALSHPVPHDAPSLSRTVPHDGPRYPYDGAGDSDKALAGAGRGNLHIRQQAHMQYTSQH